MAVITIFVVLSHVFLGGIVIQPPRPKIRKATKAHVAVLLAVMALLKAGDYWITRYELTNTSRGSFTGPNYTVVNAELPAMLLLVLIAVATAGLYLSSLWTNTWRPAVVASALWAVVALGAGVVYPALMQSLVVTPNKKDKEAEFIAYNIEATRHALGIDKVTVEEVAFGSLTTEEVTDSSAAMLDVRLIKPDGKMESRFRTDEGQPGMTIADLDPDRYVVDGREQQVIVGARELDLTQVGNKSWQGTHIINTHGCGLAVAPAAQIRSDGKPAYSDSILTPERPQLYFSPTLEGYSLLRTTVAEQSCDESSVSEPYEGEAGIVLDSLVRKVAVALDEFDWNLFGSSAITDETRYVSVRDVEDRVAQVAPFLALDADPYPVVVQGRVLWVIDAYTTSDRYPYGEFADRSQLTAGSGLDREFNYVRNSVKATVDAYDGTVVLYTIDDTDPVLEVWRSAFPDLFVPADAMPDGLSDHLRYPEELFRVQTAAYSKYRLDADDFFDRRGAWSVALAPPDSSAEVLATDALDATATAAAPNDFAGESDAARFVPYYTMFHAAGDDEATFRMFRPFQPFSTTDQRKELVAYMTVSSDPETYGQLVAYQLPLDALPDGPNSVGAAIASDANVSQAVTLLGQRGSAVEFGDLNMIPVAGGVIWVRPIYVESESAGQPLLRRIVAYYDGRIGLGNSLGDALADVFPGFDLELGDVLGDVTDPTDPIDPTDPTDPVDPTDPGPDATVADLLAQADQLFADADAALAEGDFGTYGEKIGAARALVRRAFELASAP
jgi:uncharacterized membrane protein (UPF0182 family)